MQEIAGFANGIVNHKLWSAGYVCLIRGGEAVNLHECFLRLCVRCRSRVFELFVTEINAEHPASVSNQLELANPVLMYTREFLACLGAHQSCSHSQLLASVLELEAFEELLDTRLTALQRILGQLREVLAIGAPGDSSEVPVRQDAQDLSRVTLLAEDWFKDRSIRDQYRRTEESLKKLLSESA